MTTKRNLKRELDNLKSGDGRENDPVVIAITNLPHAQMWDDPDGPDSPHPELTVRPFPEQKPKSFKIATPKVLPDEYRTPNILSVVTCENAERFGTDPDSENAVTACELWDALTEEDLRAEKALRQTIGAPIPPLLEAYDPEE